MVDYDVIVVGGGPGGCAAAKTAAAKHLKVLMLERTKNPGEGNMSGSVFFKPISEEIFPGISEQPFVKRYLMGGRFSLVGCENDGTGLGLVISMSPEVTSNMLEIFRNESDKWLAEQAVKSGVKLKTACARDLIIEDNKVKGVIVDGGERIEAPITIGADGLHSMVARRSGLGTKYTNPSPKVSLAIRYVFKLPPEVLDDRIGSGGSGSINFGTGYFGGDPTQWLATLMTPSSEHGIAVASVYQPISEMAAQKVNIHQRMKWFLNLPECRRILKGAEFTYFNSHCLSWVEWVGYAKKTYMDGLMLVGDAAGMANPLDGFGANTAMVAGQMAGAVAAEAKLKGDYSGKVLAEYEKRWRASFIGVDEKLACDLSNFMMHDFGELFRNFNAMAGRILEAKLNNKSYADIREEVGSLLPWSK
ncbi:MAG: NAD(P)/FAD-dependent oxidoreductase [Dehalococcoidia bacterium]